MVEAHVGIVDLPDIGKDSDHPPRELVTQIFGVIKELNEQGVSVLLVEQNARMALKIAHRGYVLTTGRVALAGNSRELLANPEVRATYLEGGHA